MRQCTPRHIIVQVVKANDAVSILKEVREKRLATYKETPIMLTVDISSEKIETEGSGMTY